jgi:hypothetical protein
MRPILLGIVGVMGLAACSAEKPAAAPTVAEASNAPPALARPVPKSLPAKGSELFENVRATLAPCWAFPLSSGKIPPIEVRLFLKPDGTVIRSELINPAILEQSPEVRAAAVAALRTPMNPACNKLPIPLGAYKSIVIVFDQGGMM